MKEDKIIDKIDSLTKDYRKLNDRAGKMGLDEYGKELEEIIREANKIRKECEHPKIEVDKEGVSHCTICHDKWYGIMPV